MRRLIGHIKFEDWLAEFNVPWSIYALVDPRSNEVRYVGWTTNTLYVRLRRHICDSVRKRCTYKDRWVASLIDIGVRPLIEVLETGSGKGHGEAEKRWISYFKNSGAKLTNHTDGGDGAPNRFTVAERRLVRQKGIASTTPEQRSIAAKKGFANRTPEGKRAGGLKSWANSTPEQRSARSRAAAKKALAKKTPAQLKAIMQKVREGITFESRSRASKKIHANMTKEQYKIRGRKAIDAQRAGMTPEQLRAFFKKASAAGLAVRWASTRAEKAKQLQLFS